VWEFQSFLNSRYALKGVPFLNPGDRLKPYLLYAFLRNFIERASIFDFEPVFVYNLKGCQIVAGGRSIA
jgi:hypothetical protein